MYQKISGTIDLSFYMLSPEVDIIYQAILPANLFSRFSRSLFLPSLMSDGGLSSPCTAQSLTADTSQKKNLKTKANMFKYGETLVNANIIILTSMILDGPFQLRTFFDSNSVLVSHFSENS